MWKMLVAILVWFVISIALGLLMGRICAGADDEDEE